MKKDSQFPTIRQAAARGPLSEHYLRLLQRQGQLPGVFVGTHFRVNYAMLISDLEAKSTESLRGRENP